MRIFQSIFFLLFLAPLLAQQPITPQQDGNGKFFFQIGNVYFQVNAKHGARIDSFSLDGQQFLSLDTHVADMYGSTAWLSPQSLWGWPPQPQIDGNAYTGGIIGNRVVLTSAQASADKTTLKFIMRKTFSADLKDSSVTISYSIINKSNIARSFAVWEIMRVPAGGLSFFPVNGSITGDLKNFFSTLNGVAWWDYTSSETYSNKAFADGKGGWLAHIDDNRIITIKKFTDTQSNFPSNTEKEIEFYADPSRYYTEIEKHTDYKSIAVGDSSTLTMTWYLRKLPDSIEVTEGNPEILNYIDGILNPKNTGIDPNPNSVLSYSVFPNPSQGEIEIYSSKPVKEVSLILLNVLGKVVLSQTVTTGQKIQLMNFSDGIYFYKIGNSDDFTSGKLLLKK